MSQKSIDYFLEHAEKAEEAYSEVVKKGTDLRDEVRAGLTLATANSSLLHALIVLAQDISERLRLVEASLGLLASSKKD